MPWYFYTKTGYLVTPKSPTVIPVGGLVVSPLPYTSTPPDKYLFCTGQAVLKNSYLELYNAIGGIYGETPGVGGTFNLPDCQGRFLRGIITSASGITSPACYGGAKTHSHTILGHTHTITADLHTHTMSAHSHTIYNHQHYLAAHRHRPGSLLVSASVENYNTADLDGGAAPPNQISATAAHAHGGNLLDLSGITGTGANHPSTSNGSGSTGNSTAGLNSANISGTSGASSSAPSTLNSNIPSYLTMSVLIKAEEG
jgi:microcystin-dependent protein